MLYRLASVSEPVAIGKMFKTVFGIVKFVFGIDIIGKKWYQSTFS